MELKGKTIGFAVTGSHCTFPQIPAVVQALKEEGADIVPIFSKATLETDTRFFRAEDFARTIEFITGRKPISTIVEAEPIGPNKLLDALVVAPCTGNTLAKTATAVTDGPVTMAVKAHLRNGRPLILAISTNDGLSQNAKNIGLLLNMKNVYFVPFGQDNPFDKPTSLVADFKQIPQTIRHALEGRQIQPMLIGYRGDHA